MDPNDFAEGTRAFLRDNGLVDIVPPIRSSDYALAVSDPFRYYLVKRLGISRPMELREALEQGTWFHAALERWDPLSPTPVTITDLVEETKRERKSKERELGLSPEYMEAVLENTEKDAAKAMAVFRAATTLPISPKIGTISDFLARKDITTLANELPVRVPTQAKAVSMVVFDKILYQKSSHKLHVFDAKTTAYPTTVRLQSCPDEFQTRHYLWTLHVALREGMLDTLLEEYGIPKQGLEVGSMIHWAVRKPNIKLCGYDRDFREYQHEITRGPRKGEVETRREYRGEPKFENFLQRIKDCMRGEGDWESEKRDRLHEPYSNLSFTPFSQVYDGWRGKQYERQLDYMVRVSTQDAFPIDFLPATDRLYSGGESNPYTPFYMLDPDRWPSVMRQDGLIVSHRSDPVELPDE